MPDLESWRREIESHSGGRIILVRVETDTARNVLTIPPGFPGRSVIAGLLREETFVAQFLRAHALTVNYDGSEGRFHFILLNMALAKDWEGREDSLLAHEYGHGWLHALGYGTPDYDASAPCLGVHAGDMVQHVLIREETRRRGLDSMAYWTRTQEDWLRQRESASNGLPPLDACQRLQLIGAWLDAQLGLTAADWPALPRYLQHLRARHPDLAPAVQTLDDLLRGRNLWDRSIYQWVLLTTVRILRKYVVPP